MSSKTVTAAFEKYVKNNHPNAGLGWRAELREAYMQGRRDLQAEQKRQRQLEAKRERLTKAE